MQKRRRCRRMPRTREGQPDRQVLVVLQGQREDKEVIEQQEIWIRLCKSSNNRIELIGEKPLPRDKNS